MLRSPVCIGLTGNAPESIATSCAEHYDPWGCGRLWIATIEKMSQIEISTCHSIAESALMEQLPFVKQENP